MDADPSSGGRVAFSDSGSRLGVDHGPVWFELQPVIAGNHQQVVAVDPDKLDKYRNVVALAFDAYEQDDDFAVIRSVNTERAALEEDAEPVHM